MNISKFREGWYVMYTKSNYEKKVFQELKVHFDIFFPTTKKIVQKSQAKRVLEKPLFKSYVFIYLKNEKERLKALRTNGVFNYVNIAGKPVIVTKKEIDTIKLFIGELSNIELAPYEICIGQKRRINFGPFSGYDCYIVDYNGNDKVIVRIDSLKSCVSAELKKVHLAELC
ncbi:transcription termination/antitermination protein NusG [Snuella sedimenti]|uniref:Transcription termination/antitermination NusG family protein n=1 Tax=Snuella sedimenti TaxID=2798802 RepID=A0A8J7LUH1_9FLAO|nr:UpxY family transcription antiterminator [Snuella sedimenti]MBJ6369750.1 transcription termination/antitermination NusG family protein [Snuella sedimenti]